jgi:hypothetical protein
MKKLLLLFFLFLLYSSLDAQLSIAKLVGKNANNFKLGYGLFSFWDFHLNDQENKSIRLELMDIVVFPGKGGGSFFTNTTGKGYFSLKLGYKNIFSETKTGFYLEPSVGWCRVVSAEEPDGTYGDGIALALEGGYSLEVGERGHSFNFGLKYETDRAGSPSYTINSIGFRVSYAFNMFRKKDDY